MIWYFVGFLIKHEQPASKYIIGIIGLYAQLKALGFSLLFACSYCNLLVDTVSVSPIVHQKNTKKKHNSDTPFHDHMLRSPNWSRMFFHGREVAPKKSLYVVNPGLTLSFATCRYPAKTTWLVLQIKQYCIQYPFQDLPKKQTEF